MEVARVYVATCVLRASACLLDPDLISIPRGNPSFPHRGESEVFIRPGLRITRNFLLWFYFCVSMCNQMLDALSFFLFPSILSSCCVFFVKYGRWVISYFVFFLNFTMNFYEKGGGYFEGIGGTVWYGDKVSRLLYEILFSVLLFLFGILIFLKYSIFFMCIFFSFFFFFGDEFLWQRDFIREEFNWIIWVMHMGWIFVPCAI